MLWTLLIVVIGSFIMDFAIKEENDMIEKKMDDHNFTVRQSYIILSLSILFTVMSIAGIVASYTAKWRYDYLIDPLIPMLLSFTLFLASLYITITLLCWKIQVKEDEIIFRKFRTPPKVYTFKQIKQAAIIYPANHKRFTSINVTGDFEGTLNFKSIYKIGYNVFVSRLGKEGIPVTRENTKKE